MGGVQSDKWEDMSLVGVVTRGYMQAGVEFGKLCHIQSIKDFSCLWFICKMSEWDK